MLFYTNVNFSVQKRFSNVIYNFNLNTTYYIAIAVHKLDNNNVHYNYAQNKQTKTNKQKQTNKQTKKKKPTM